MTCGVSSRRAIARSSLPQKSARPVQELVARDAASVDLKAAFEVAGTWDFKWPLGTTIRIAFQELPPAMKISPEDFEAAQQHVRALAERWIVALPNISEAGSESPRPALKLDFEGDDLDSPFDDDEFKVARHRSAFREAEAKARPYDVLISLQDLPVTKFDPFRGDGHEDEIISLPISALGSYARRADYGAPTMYIGRFGHFKTEQFDFARYLEDPLVRSIIVHEFGHMLGLPHMHQHPQLVGTADINSSATGRVEQLDAARGEFYKSPKEVAKMVGNLLGVEVPTEIARDSLINVWRGNEAFSDWPKIEAQKIDHEKTGKLDSIMTFPYYRHTLRNAKSCAVCGNSKQLHEQLGAYIDEPGALDKEMLRVMYDPNYAG